MSRRARRERQEAKAGKRSSLWASRQRCIGDVARGHDARSRTLNPVSAILALLVLLGLAAAWHVGPLAQWLSIPALATATEHIVQWPLAPAVVVAAYVVAGFIVVPINIVIVATVLVFGPLHGTLYAYAGVLISTTLTYVLARRLGALAPAYCDAPRVRVVRDYVAQRGWLAVFIVRVLPVAPFTVINTIAGASRIPLRTFLVGTALGMAPGIAGIAFFADAVAQAIRQPMPLRFALIAAVGALVLGCAVLMRRLMSARSR